MRKPYPSDLTDEQWAIIEPLIPVTPVGRPRIGRHAGGPQRHLLPQPLGMPVGHAPARPAGQEHGVRPLRPVEGDGTWQKILDALRQQVRVAGGQRPQPQRRSIDSQTVKATEIADSRGYDGGKKITGRKRHILVDTLGLLVVVLVSVASADDGTFAPEVLGRLTAEHQTRLKKHLGRREVPQSSPQRLVGGDRGRVRDRGGGPPGRECGYVKLPRRWVVERTFAWLGRYRRNSRDYERFTESSEAMIKVSWWCLAVVETPVFPGSFRSDEFSAPKRQPLAMIRVQCAEG